MVSEPWPSASNHMIIVTKFNYFSAKNMELSWEYFIAVSFFIFNIKQIVPHLYNLTPSTCP